MEYVNVTLPVKKNDTSDLSVMDKSFFKEMVFQAYYYPNTSLTINNIVVSNLDAVTTICGETSSLNKGCFENVLDFLWKRLHCSATTSFHFKSNFEDVTYIINK